MIDERVRTKGGQARLWERVINTLETVTKVETVKDFRRRHPDKALGLRSFLLFSSLCSAPPWGVSRLDLPLADGLRNHLESILFYECHSEPRTLSYIIERAYI